MQKPPGKRAPSTRRLRVGALAGGAVEEDWFLRVPPEPVPETPFLPPETPLLLVDDLGCVDGEAAAGSQAGDRVERILAFLADPEKARACAHTRVIETPDFRLADESESLGRTRGVGHGSKEDTSDEAYTRRHARHERLEKKLRRQEKEGLVRDRRKHVDRVVALEQLDVRAFVPALAAHDAERKAPPRSEAELEAHLARVRADLLADARLTLARYNKLLPDEAAADRGEEPARTARSETPPDEAPRKRGRRPSMPRAISKSRLSSVDSTEGHEPRRVSRRTGPSLSDIAQRENAVRPAAARGSPEWSAAQSPHDTHKSPPAPAPTTAPCARCSATTSRRRGRAGCAVGS